MTIYIIIMLLFSVKKILPQYNKNYCKDGTYDNSPESVEKLEIGRAHV